MASFLLMIKTLADYYGAPLAADAAESLAWLLTRVGNPRLGEFSPEPDDDSGGLLRIGTATRAANQATVVTAAAGSWELEVQGRSYFYFALSTDDTSDIADALAGAANAGETGQGEVAVEFDGNPIQATALAHGSHGNQYTLKIFAPLGGVGGTPQTLFSGGQNFVGLAQARIRPAGVLDFDDLATQVIEGIDINGGKLALHEGSFYPNQVAVSGSALNLSAARTYTIKVFTIIDTEYQQGATINVPGGTSGTYAWSGINAGGPVIIASLYDDLGNRWDSTEGTGPKLTNHYAKVWVKTDIPYEQQTNIPVRKVSATEAFIGGRTPVSGQSVDDAGNPNLFITILRSDVSPAVTVYTSRAFPPVFPGLPRSSVVPPADPYYLDIEQVFMSGDPVLQNRCWIYDAALIIFAFTAGGRHSEAAAVIGELNRLMDLRVYMPEIAYFDAEDALTTNWSLFSGSGTISNIFDPARGPDGSRVIKLNTASAGVFRYSMTANTTDKWIEVSLNSFATAFELRFDITSSGGTTQIKFTNGLGAPSKAATVITYPLGAFNGWRKAQYDLDAILKLFVGGDNLTEITRMEVNLASAGNFYLDDFTAGDLQPDGSLSFSYDIYFGHVDYPYIRAGALAWIAMAYSYFRDQTGITSIVDSFLTRMLNFIVTLQSAVALPDLRHDLIQVGYGRYSNPGYGFVVGLVEGCSTEHNVDCYFALKMGFRQLGTANWNTVAEEIRAALLSQFWIPPTATVPGHFAAGADSTGLDLGESVDSMGTWSAMLMHEIGDLFRETECLRFVKNTFHVTGQTVAIVPRYDTTITEAITASGSAQWVTPASMNGMVDRGWVVIDSGASQEGVQVVGISGSQIQAVFLKNHSATAAAFTETRMNLVYSNATAIEGYKPYAAGNPGAPAGVWPEGTWGAIPAYLRAMENSRIAAAISGLDAHVQTIVNGQKTLRLTTPNDHPGALLAITQAHRNLPYEFSVFRGIAQTCWFYVEAVAPHVLLSEGGHPVARSYTTVQTGRGYSREAVVPTVIDAAPHAFFGDGMFGDKRFGE